MVCISAWQTSFLGSHFGKSSQCVYSNLFSWKPNWVWFFATLGWNEVKRSSWRQELYRTMISVCFVDVHETAGIAFKWQVPLRITSIYFCCMLPGWANILRLFPPLLFCPGTDFVTISKYSPIVEDFRSTSPHCRSGCSFTCSLNTVAKPNQRVVSMASGESGIPFM